MASLTRNGERCHTSRSCTHWSTDVSHYNKTSGFCSECAGRKEGCSRYSKERPSPEGAGSSGDSRKTMCQRTNGDSPFKSFNGQLTRYDGYPHNNASYGVTMFENASERTSGRKPPCCDKCSATLVALKKQALTLAVHHHLSSKDLSDMSAFLRDNLRVHSSRSTSESKDKEQGACAACGVHLNQLRQEAIHLALSREQARWQGHSSASLPRQQAETKSGGRAPTEKAATLAGLAGVQHHGRTHSPSSPRSPRTPQRTPQTPRRRGPKAPNPDMGRWVEEQQQLTAKSASTTEGDGVAIFPYKTGDGVTAGYGDGGTPQSTQRIPHISRVAALANSVAVSLLTRAAQKLNLSRRKGLCPRPVGTRGGLGHQSTCFRGVILKSPPPTPPALLQAAMRTKDSPNTGQVKVVLRVGPSQSEGPSLPAVLRIEPSKKRVIVMDAVSNSQSRLTEVLKTFTFDAAYPQESSQAEVCAGVLADVIRCVLSGSDGCVLGLGCAEMGCWSTMAGTDEGPQTLGLMPCAVSWLYSAVERRREKTWTDMTVSVSAVELCYGQEETLRDLLAEVAPSVGNDRGSPVAQISVHEDPIYGIQLRNHNRVKAPNAERAASLLDAAIASRLHGNQVRGGAEGNAAMPLCHSSIMFFTIHVQPLRTDIGTLGRVSRGPVKLTMIDVYSSVKGLAEASKTRVGRPHSELGPVILSLMNGHRDIPSKGSKLTMLFKAAMGHMNCSTTVIAQVSDRPSHHLESLSTIQLASRIFRTYKRTKQSMPCSPSGRSLSKDRKGPRSLSLRSYHSTGEVHVDIPRLRLRCDFDERSSSDQSCDTVIHIDSEGSVQPKAALTRVTQPEFVPIIPSLHPCKAQADDPEFTALLKELLSIPRPPGEKHVDVAYAEKDDAHKAEMKPLGDCLKCDTFAELQERLGCIDFSQIGMGVAKIASKEPNAGSVCDKSQPQCLARQQASRESPAAPQTLLSSQTLVKQKDGAVPGDTFQREDSGLYDCEDCSAASSSEEPPNQTLTLNRICQADRRNLPESACAKTPDTLHLVNCEMAAQSTVTPHSLALALKPRRNQGAAEVRDHRKPETRTSPVGKSSPISPSPFSPTAPDSSSPSLATSVMLGDILPQFPTEEVKEMKATITVTFQQPLDQTGQDELVFSVVEEVTISGTLDRDRKGRNIIRINDGPKSQAHVQGSVGSLPVRIIGNVSEEPSTAECSKMPVSPAVQAVTKEGSAQKHLREARILPSFINPTLVYAECNLDVDSTSTDGVSLSEPHQPSTRCPEKEREKRGIENHVKFSNSTYMSPLCQTSYDKPNNEDATCHNDVENVCGTRHRNTDRSYPREKEHVCPSKTPRGLLGGEIGCRIARNTPESVSASTGCLATAPDAFKAASLPRCWHGANNGDNSHKYPGGVTSSTPCSPGVTLERRKGKQHCSAHYDLLFSPPLKHIREKKREGVPMQTTSGSLYKASSLSGRPSSPVEDSSRLFIAKLEHLSGKTNSLGRTPVEFQPLDRGSSTSVNSKGSSKGSVKGNCMGGSKGWREGSCKVAFKESYDDDFTFPRVSKGPRRTPEYVDIAEPSHPFTSSHNHPAQSPRSTHSKLSAVGKLKMASPKARRLSAPSSKGHSFSQKGLHQHSINRSASLSPDGKTLSPEHSPSYLSSSPPWSLHSISRTSSQSSNCSTAKSLIQGVFNGRFSDLMTDRDASARGPDTTDMAPAAEDAASPLRPQALPSPYSRVTAPRTPSHMSGYGSDATSVLSGELPPAMGKTALLFPSRSSVVSSGYESMLRDSEAAGSGASARDSVSDRSPSLLGVAHGGHASRRRGNAGSTGESETGGETDLNLQHFSLASLPSLHPPPIPIGSQPRHLPCNTPSSIRRSVSGARARWVDRGIPESYEIKVYEIDDVARMQRRAGASKKGPGCFSAKLKFLEHRQQRISEVRAKYYSLKRELEQAKRNLMLEPGKWNRDFDLWQTFEVDSLEHLEALQGVTARLESKLNLCKANVMMVTCFDVTSKKRQRKKRRQAALGQRGFLGV